MTNKRKSEIINEVSEIKERLKLMEAAPINDIAVFCKINYGCIIKLCLFSKKTHLKKYHVLDVLVRINPNTEKLEILINQDHHENLDQVRFTIAYALARYLLGHFNDQPSLTSGDVINLFTQNINEQEANLFAAELLIPSKILKGEIDINYCAKHYRIPRSVVQYLHANTI